MSNYFTVKSYVRLVTRKDTSTLTDATFDVLEPIVRQRLDNDVKLRALVTEATISPVINPFTIAADMKELLELSYQYNGYTIRIEAASREAVAGLLNESGYNGPHFYNVEGDRVRVAPFTSGQELTARYRQGSTALSSNSDSNEYTLNHFAVIANAFLISVYEILRDFEAANRYAALYESEVGAINDREALIEASETVQMEGASSWV